jgi:DNA topoisomerase-3
MYDKTEANEFFNKLAKETNIRITKVEQKETAQAPPLLYDLSALQQDANKRHGFTAEQTLNIAQKLYEEKYISYPRTGSRYIPEDVFAEIPDLIKSLEKHPLFGSHAKTIVLAFPVSPSYPNSPVFPCVNNEKVTDHHALIITGVVPGKLGKDEQTIYDMIAGCMLEAFSQKCVKEILVIQAESENGIQFETRGSKIKEYGWRGVFNLAEEKPEDENTQPIPALLEGEQFTPTSNNMLGKQTRPKSFFTEATLLAAMERAGNECEIDENQEVKPIIGIGTPATRAGIIETLLKRRYMERDKKNLIPTERGLHLYHAVKNLQIADASLTVEWECKLAQIEKEPTFREVFMEEIREYTKKVVDEISSVELPGNIRKLPCPKCKSGTVAIFAKVAKCSDETCNLTVFKSICGKSLTDKQIEELLKNGKTGLIKGFKGKKGVVFDAILRFDESYSIGFEFAHPGK